MDVSNSLSDHTKATLLLTAPLLSGREGEPPPLLAPKEFNRFVSYLDSQKVALEELLGPRTDALFTILDAVIERERLEVLLSRGFLLGPAVDAWQSRSIWVTSRGERTYPEILQQKLQDHSPAILFGCGDAGLLQSGGLAVVGSRNADGAALSFTESTAESAAKSSITIVSGGARGVDQVAMRSGLNVGGSVVGVLADSLSRAVTERQNIGALREGLLTLVSPFDPNAGFNVGNAMQRNKMIYALADSALVVNVELKKGGTWAGAKEQLERFRCGPVYVADLGDPSAGREELIRMGALAWPHPTSRNDYLALAEIYQSREPQLTSTSVPLFDL